jgi:hypothetical protein
LRFDGKNQRKTLLLGEIWRIIKAFPPKIETGGFKGLLRPTAVLE